MTHSVYDYSHATRLHSSTLFSWIQSENVQILIFSKFFWTKRDHFTPSMHSPKPKLIRKTGPYFVKGTTMTANESFVFELLHSYVLGHCNRNATTVGRASNSQSVSLHFIFQFPRRPAVVQHQHTDVWATKEIASYSMAENLGKCRSPSTDVIANNEVATL